MKISKIQENGARQVSLREKAYERIKQEIIRLELSPGEPLRESVLAKRFQISKTPIREALTSLQQENLVEYQPNRGFVVSAVTVKDLQELYEARLFFESLFIRLAIQRITPEEILELERNLEIRYDPADPSSLERYIEGNVDFHMGIAKASRNSRLISQYKELLDEAQRLIYMDLKNNNVFETWHTSHRRFLDAICQRDEQAGILALEETMENAKKRILGL